MFEDSFGKQPNVIGVGGSSAEFTRSPIRNGYLFACAGPVCDLLNCR